MPRKSVAAEAAQEQAQAVGAEVSAEQSAEAPAESPAREEAAKPDPRLKEVQVFTLSKSRYVKQVGAGHESYIQATPESPVQVRLPKYIKRVIVLRDENGVETGRETRIVEHPEDAHLKKVAPPKPKDVRPNRLAASVERNVARPEGVRAADT